MKTKKTLRQKTGSLLFVLLVTVAAYLCFYKLGVASLENWDESWYADMVKNMLRTGDYIATVFNRHILLDKPPMFIWFGVFFSKLFGLSEFSVRFVSGLAGFLTIVMACRYAWKRWGTVAMFFCFGTLALNNVFIWRTRTANIDALATFFIFASFIAVMQKSNKKYIWLGIIFACAYLTKASLAYFPLVLIASGEILYEFKHLLRRFGWYLLMIAIPVIICGFWLHTGDMQIGGRFSEYYLYHSDQNVAHITKENFKTDYIMFTYYSLQRRFTYLLVFGLVFLLWKWKKKESFLLVGFSLALLFMLSFTERKNNWYLMPSMPFWSLVIGYAAQKIADFFKKYPLIIAAFVLVSFYLFIKTLRVNIMPIVNTSSTRFQAESSKYVKAHSGYDEIVIRMDEMYPTSIYYTDRKVLSFSVDSAISDFFIGWKDLSEMLGKKQIRWFIGNKDKAVTFAREFLKDYPYTTVFKNDEEVVFLLR
ncbi:hypothetical protein GYA28_00100 [Candidatus Roizmanbacteria bacterium]|jgi:4-amino-4-deoxy-L-arabinose transferase-like glycosyltransferase|nr:hypothetical protein [Candidatus Roizmanbacteria bacterium]